MDAAESETSASVSILFLPVEVVAVIFRNIDLLERRALKLTCRLFRDAVNYIVIRELVTHPSPHSISSHCWYSTTEFVDPALILAPLSIKLLFSSGPIEIYNKLNRISINQEMTERELGSLVGRIWQLKHLEVQYLVYQGINKSINVPHLEVLVVGGANYGYPLSPSRCGPPLDDDYVPEKERTPLKFLSKRLTTICLGTYFVYEAVSCPNGLDCQISNQTVLSPCRIKRNKAHSS